MDPKIEELHDLMTSAGKAGLLDDLFPDGRLPEGLIESIRTSGNVNAINPSLSMEGPESGWTLDEVTRGLPQTPGRPPTSNGVIIIGIAGGSGSGKTYLANQLMEIIPDEHGVLTSGISMDDYYLDQSTQAAEDRDALDYDDPSAFDIPALVNDLRALAAGKMIEAPVYDFSTHTRRPETRTIVPARIVIVEGILLFAIPELLNLFHVRVFRPCTRVVRFRRRLSRDMEERGRTVEAVVHQWPVVAQAHEEHVEPSSQFADLSVGQAHRMEDVASETVKLLIEHFAAFKRRPEGDVHSELIWKSDGEPWRRVDDHRQEQREESTDVQRVSSRWIGLLVTLLVLVVGLFGLSSGPTDLSATTPEFNTTADSPLLATPIRIEGLNTNMKTRPLPEGQDALRHAADFALLLEETLQAHRGASRLS